MTPVWEHDPLRDRWVVHAPARGDRPGPGRAGRLLGGCPFCPGNENATPPELGRAEAEGAWSARAFANLYPAFEPGRGAPGPAAAANGDHEVVVLSTRHHATPADLDPHEVAAASSLFRQRVRAHLESGRRWVQVFVNHGHRAGATVEHPHGQLVALDHVPAAILTELSALRAGDCALCALEGDESHEVLRRAGWVVSVPPWASAPGEMLIRTVEHRPSTPDKEELDLALLTALRALRRAYGDPDFNLVAHPAPRGHGGHDHLHLYPRTTRRAGFELATGIQLNPSDPERDARRLRTLASDTIETR